MLGETWQLNIYLSCIERVNDGVIHVEKEIQDTGLIKKDRSHGS